MRGEASTVADYRELEPWIWEQSTCMEKPRKCSREFFIAAFVYACMVGMLVLWFIMMTSGANFSYVKKGEYKHSRQDCVPEGLIFLESSRVYMNKDTCERLNQCFINNGAKGLIDERRLLDSDPSHNSVFRFLAKHWYMPFVMVCSCAVLCCVWLVFIWKCAIVVIWITIVGTLAATIGLPILLIVHGAYASAIFSFVFPVIYAVFVFTGRHKINVAAQMATTSMQALFSNFHVILVSFLTLFGEIVLLVMVLTFSVNFCLHLQIKPAGCALQLRYSVLLLLVYILCYFIGVQFLRGARLMAMTASYCGWYFGEEGYQMFCWRGLGWAFGPLAGATGVYSLINGVMDWMSGYYGGNCIFNVFKSMVFSDPLGYLFSVFCCCATCLQGLTAWGLMAVTHTGEPIMKVGQPMRALLTNWFGDAFVTNVIARTTMANLFFPLSLAVAIGSWGWADGIDDNVDTFATPCKHMGNLCHETPTVSDGSLVVTGLYLIFLFLVFPFRGCLLILLISESCLEGQTEKDLRYLRNVLIGGFVGYVSTILVDFVTDMIVNGVNICMFCFAIEQESGEGTNGDFSDFHTAIGMMYEDAIVSTHFSLDTDESIEMGVRKKPEEAEGGGREEVENEGPENVEGGERVRD